MKILKFDNKYIILAVMALFMLYMLWQAFRPAPKYIFIPYEATTAEEYTEKQEEHTEPKAEIRQIVKQVTEQITEKEEKPESYTKKQMVATAYCSCKKCCGKYAENRPKDENGEEIVITASGTRAKAGRTIAVDKSVIPFGTEIIIDGKTYIAEDTGGAIKGNRIDIYFDNHDEALNFGKKTITVLFKNADV